MGGEYFADDDGVLELRIGEADGSDRYVRLSGYEPGEEVYGEVTRGRHR